MTQEQQERYVRARRTLISRQFSALNNRQLEAVLTTEGPLLVLAGAGSGKTTVLIHRIANLISFGRASDSTDVPSFVNETDLEELEAAVKNDLSMDPRLQALCSLDPVSPWSIIAITFTNKAANQMKERLSAMLGAEAEDIWAMTFHSACCRILRRYIDRLGYTSRFTIYDTADSERVMKDVIKDLNIDEKDLPVKTILSQISRAKDQMLFPQEYEKSISGMTDYRLALTAKCYHAYQTRLQEANALDFDDIILLAVKLLQEDEEARDYYQQKFRYVLIDEYQDTNNLQYLLSSLLTGAKKNICVVGDDDQSIYRFRGATIENILNFEKQYHGAKLIRLEQNYRSTKQILSAANAVISHNNGRKGKTLWTENEVGDKIFIKRAVNESDEANYVASRIFSLVPPSNYKDCAILYRTNAQSNALERSFKFNAIPYRIIGGTRFFDRAEVKDMLAYLWVINNRADDLRLRRILNNPPRGIGTKTIETVERLADSAQYPLYYILSDPYHYPALEKSAAKLMTFAVMIEDCAKLLDSLSLPEFYDELLVRTGYAAMLEEKNDVESRTRLENVKELRSSIVGYVQNHPDDASLGGFLEEIALYTDIEQYDASADAVVMMTIHSAKGLEFPHVFLVGAEEGLFPSLRCIGEQKEMEEERRLCYVAITRAKKTLTVSYAEQRMLYGHTTTNRPSRFIEEIPAELTNASVRKPQSSMPSSDRYGVQSGIKVQGAYSNRIDNPKPRNGFQTYQKPVSASVPDYKPGDMVRHNAFGRGMVISVLKMGNDAMLEIAFDDVGTKKLMARTASVHMSKLNF